MTAKAGAGDAGAEGGQNVQPHPFSAEPSGGTARPPLPDAAVETAEHYAVVVVTDGTRVLLAHHRRRGWELPGGRIELRERPSEAAAREVHEECGLAIRGLVPLLSHHRADGSIGHLFLAFAPGGTSRDGLGAEESIDRWAFVERLPPERELAFPDDPYEEVFAAVEKATGGEVQARRWLE